MIFIILLIVTVISLAGAAAFFSIYGLASIFSGSFWPVVIMGSTLEAGKLVAASYVYRFWDIINWVMKTYLITAILILMVITSMGIFGYLSMAYQKDTLPYKEIEDKLILLKEEKVELLKRSDQIAEVIAKLPGNYATLRLRTMKQYEPETEKITARLPKITEEIQKLSNMKLTTEAHTGPIIYIAKAFDKEIDDATKYVILLIIFAFDPLAVILTIGANIALVNRVKDRQKIIIQDEREDSEDPSKKWTTETITVESATPTMDKDEIEELVSGLLDNQDKNKKLAVEEMMTKRKIKDNIRKT